MPRHSKHSSDVNSFTFQMLFLFPLAEFSFLESHLSWRSLGLGNPALPRLWGAPSPPCHQALGVHGSTDEDTAVISHWQ